MLDELLARTACQRDAACLEHPASWWFPVHGQSLDAARSVCRCLVRTECLESALADPELGGVWAGTSEGELRRLRRRSGLPG